MNSLNLNYVSWVEAARIDSRMSKDMTKRLVEYFSRFPFVFKGIDRGYQYMRLLIRSSGGHTINLSVEDFFKMKEFVQDGSKLQAVKHVKESAKCGLKEAKDFMDTYCEYVL